MNQSSAVSSHTMQLSLRHATRLLGSVNASDNDKWKKLQK